MKKMRSTRPPPPASAGPHCPVAGMLKVVQLFGGTAPDIAGVQDKKALLAESITEALLSLGDD